VEARSLTVADYAVFNSRRCESAWRAHYGFETPATVIHNGVDRDVFAPRASEADGREPYVFFVGNSERKGLPAVLEYARIASLPVYIAGATDVSAPNVRCLGHVPQDRLATHYSDAEVTIHPAAFEAFGNVVLESLSCGTPVVTTADCGASELLTEDTGVVTDDIAAGVEQARQLDGADCVALAEAHTWDRVAAETLTLARRVVG